MKLETALELFVPHPGIENEDKAIELLEEEFLETMTDVNVSCLEIACFRAQEDAEGDNRGQFELRHPGTQGDVSCFDGGPCKKKPTQESVCAYCGSLIFSVLAFDTNARFLARGMPSPPPVDSAGRPHTGGRQPPDYP